jgi:hypothetical protein
MKKKKTINIAKQRNPDIVKAFKREINLQTKVVQDKTKYKRNKKHKNRMED